MAYKLEKKWTGWVRVGGERLKLFFLLGVIVGTIVGCSWVYFSTLGQGAGHLLSYANVSFQASVNPSQIVDMPIGSHTYHGDAERLRQWMQKTWYRDRSFQDLLEQALWAGLVGGVLTMSLLVYWMTRHSLEGDDETVRGPKLYKPKDLNRELRTLAVASGDEMGLVIGEVQISRRDEESHILLLGDSGSGKSSMIRTLLGQIRSQPAIVYDPEREFLADFFIPGLDTILNPLDARSPCWTPWEETRSRADMESLALSFVPEPTSDGGNSKFWVEAARTLLVAMLERIPSRDPREIARFLNSSLENLEVLIADTPAANVVNKSAPMQAQGVLATLGTAVRSLQQLRPVGDGAPVFSARDWAEKPKGWIFLCATEKHRKAILPLVSVWIDCLVRPLLDAPLANPTPVWVVADELHTLQRLATLPDLMTRARKRGIRCVFGTQSQAQFQALYGTDSKTLLSQPKTKLVYRCSEPETAKWSSDLIGQVERITHRASMSVSGRESFSLSDERRIDPLVLPAEIQKMPNLTCYLVHAGMVSQMALPVVKRLNRVKDFEPRNEEAAAGAASPSTAA